jgi:hypothetical protein
MELKRTENGSGKCPKLITLRQSCRRSKTVKSSINSNSQYTQQEFSYHYKKTLTDSRDPPVTPEFN